MFERRLKIFLALLAVFTLFLIGRAGQVQLGQHAYWATQAVDLAKRYEFVETTRGRILDCRGRELAVDLPCIDACVEYPAIGDPPDPEWVTARAKKDLLARAGEAGVRNLVRTGQYKAAVAAEVVRVNGDLTHLWADLSRLSGVGPDQIAQTRQDIVRRVEMRRRYVWWRSYQAAMRRAAAVVRRAWYRNWMGGGGGAADDGPKLDDFKVDVAEQFQAHVILRAVSADVHNELANHLDRYPGLSLVPSKHRVYPYGAGACHVLGHLSSVTREDIDAGRAAGVAGGDDDAADADADAAGSDKDRRELAKYWPNDLIGRAGVEALCERTLRGTRGRITRSGANDEVIENLPPRPGKDVALSLDMELQSDVEQAFAQRRETKLARADKSEYTEVREDQHGAAVVIDVATGQVRAMVSNPGFDLNQYDALYPALSRDDLNQPLLNRATQMALEPGSSVKTVVGSGAITHGYIAADGTVECTGYLVLRGHKYRMGRCWVASQFEGQLGESGVAHHPIPWSAPHPTGNLTVADGLERSCNVVFETLADRMGQRELVHWFDAFGLGRPTGVGVEESPGSLPEAEDVSPHSPRIIWTWFAGIGQGMVHATPVQMANVAATLARRGLWKRPRLVDDADVGRVTTRPSAPPAAPVDLHLSPDAVAQVRDGMVAVTSAKAGTGLFVHPNWDSRGSPPDALDNFIIAGKTGSAQVPEMSIPVRDDAGEIERDDAGRQQRQHIPLGTPGTQSWYMGVGDKQDRLDHAWFIGYAPADRPQVAFAVMVQYGGTGGRVAGQIAHDLLVACARHGYLTIPDAKPAFEVHAQ